MISWAYWGLTRCGPFDKICLSSFGGPFGGFYRVPHKDINYIDQLDEKLLGALRNGLEIKVGWVLKSSGNFLSNKYKNIIIWSRNAWEKWCQRYLPLEKSKNEHQNMSTSTNMHHFLPACIDFKKSSKNLRGIFYQMDDIWWAPSRLKKTFALIFLEILVVLLRQDFLKTLDKLGLDGQMDTYCDSLRLTKWQKKDKVF